LKSILELGLEFFIPKKNLMKYDMISNQNKPIEDRIYELLTFNPKLMFEVPNNQELFLKARENLTKKLISDYVASNKKIEFVTFYFNAKSSKNSITNNFIFPDAADFLTLLHLTLVFKKINEIYKPGANLFIGVECNFFHKFATQDLRTTSEMTDILMRFKTIIETMIKTKTFIYLYDVYEEISFFKKDFLTDIELEKFDFLSNENALEELKKSANYYYNFVIEQSYFPSEEAAHNFCIFHSLYAIGYSTAIRKIKNVERGLFENYNQKILINPRFFEDSHSNIGQNEIFLPLLPGSFTFSFNMLTLKKRTNKWHQITYEDIKECHYQEFFVQDLAYPFLFTEKRFLGDEQ
jgi:hypothetical protein